MSSADGKADIQVTHPGHIFPFGSCGSSPLPHLTQCCRFSVPERLPLQPFRQDRLTKLPLPPSLMASSCKTVALTGTGAAAPQERPNAVDPQQKITQLEKNIAFIQESHRLILRSLHEEVEELKQKNRELQFQLVTGVPALPPEPEEHNAEEISPKLQEKVEKLEKEVRKVRNALKDALKTNTTLSHEIELLKRERYASSSSSVASTSKGKEYVSDPRRMHTPNLPSPEVEEYSDTLRKIQKAAGERNSKSSEGHYMERSNHGWGKGGSGYVENRRSYNYHHRMMQQTHNHHGHQQQPRLPRLPLRNQQQNYMSHHQYQETQYRQGTSGTLPTLKQSHNEHQSRQRKSRGPPQPAKVTDQIYNH